MEKRVIAASLEPEVIITQVAGNLEVKGWDRPEVVIYAEPGLLTVEESEDGVRLSCLGNCEIRLPSGANLQVETVQGDARLKQLSDTLQLGAVHGSLYIKEAGDVQIGAVYGDLWVKYSNGDFQAGQVSGNASARQVHGRCELGKVIGDADLRGIDGEVVLHAEGDVRLQLPVLGGIQYALSCQGDLRLYLAEDASARLSLASESREIRLRLPERSETLEVEATEVQLGDGQASFAVKAGGTVILVSEAMQTEAEGEPGSGVGADFERQIADQIETQIKAQMEEMTARLQEQLAQVRAQVGHAGLTPEETERIMARARQASEHANERAQEKLRRAQEKLERKLEAVRAREEARARSYPSRGWSVRWPAPPAAPRPPTPPPQPPQATEEERLMILRMLEQKKISLEEAEKLLSALEGK